LFGILVLRIDLPVNRIMASSIVTLLPETLPHLLWHQKLLLDIGIGIGYKLSHTGVGKKRLNI
jgi:hypothetical protein